MISFKKHFYISNLLNLGSWVVEITAGINPPTDSYPFPIMVAAYGTAFLTVGLLFFLYYQAGHLLKISNRAIKTLTIAAIILEIKGDFFRQPVMDYFYNLSLDTKNPLFFVFLNHVDKWVANLLLALALVYFCPTKYKTEQKYA
jgi:hypothetical protein